MLRVITFADHSSIIVRQFSIFLLLIFLQHIAIAQNEFNCIVKSIVTKDNIQGATVVMDGINKKAGSVENGIASIRNIPAGSYIVHISHVGFEEETIEINVPQTGSLLEIYLKPKEENMEEVIVSSSRTNSRIEDLPTKVEVLGSEEVTEENGIKPGNIASMLGDIAGIQVQQTSAATGSSEARIQGLPGKYTQILRDGIPLFGGYSGGFSILQIPPMDLKQIEIVKGASSTLYGGGAIAGMINLVSRSPKINSPERSVTINQSTLKESNINAFFSNRGNKVGYTLFAGGTYQRAVDVNKDGFSDVPDLKAIFFHPRLFFYPNKKQTIVVGYNFNYEDRNGGDMEVLHAKAGNDHQFFIQNKSTRNSVDAQWENKHSSSGTLTVKAAASFFRRDIYTNGFTMKADQQSFFTEASYVKKMSKHTLLAGINFSAEQFLKRAPDSIYIPGYKQKTTGVFLQDDWKIYSKVIVEAGCRLDHHNFYGNFLLPRVSVLYKINNLFSTRLGGGLGYKTAFFFSGETDERDYPRVAYAYFDSLKAERSKGINWDINYKQKMNGWSITVNQMFYITDIKQPLFFYSLPDGKIAPANAGRPLNTKGSETYIAVSHNELELYLGYTYTVAKQLYNAAHPNVSLSARNKFATVAAYEFSEGFRAGIEASYTGRQYLDNGNTTPAYLFTAAMVRYDIKNISFVLNCENIFDYRQTRQERIFYPPVNNPLFKQIWAPLDGRVINLSARIKW